MKTLILYETKAGYTKECAQYIKDHVNDCEMHDMKENTYNLDEFDVILVGAPIYVGEFEPQTMAFFKDNKKLLLKKKLGLFCAGMNTAEFNMAVQNSLPYDLFVHADIVHCGGRIEYDSLSRKERRTIRRRLGISKSEHIDYMNKMDLFVDWVNKK